MKGALIHIMGSCVKGIKQYYNMFCKELYTKCNQKIISTGCCFHLTRVMASAIVIVLTQQITSSLITHNNIWEFKMAAFTVTSPFLIRACKRFQWEEREIDSPATSRHRHPGVYFGLNHLCNICRLERKEAHSRPLQPAELVRSVLIVHSCILQASFGMLTTS